MTFPSVTDTHVCTHCSCLALITRNAHAHVSTCQSLALILVVPVSRLNSGLRAAWRNFLLNPSITFLHKPNPWCLRMANPEPLPQRATRISRRLRGQEPVLESCPARVVGSAATPPSGGLSPNGDNSNPSLHHFLTQGDTKTKKRV